MEFSSLSISINVDPNKQTSPSDMYEMILKKNDEDLVNSVELSLTDSLQKRVSF